MGESRVQRLFLPCCLRRTGSFRRCPLSNRSLILASACVVYLLVSVSQVGYSQRDRSVENDGYRRTRGLYHLDVPDSVDVQTGAGFVVPTRSNVVYITLKPKPLKPAHIRGTIRPKARRRARRRKRNEARSAFTHPERGTMERRAGQTKRGSAPTSSRGGTGGVVYYKSLEIIPTEPRADFHISSIRIYSRKAPPWLSPRDVDVMRFLADAKVLRVKEVFFSGAGSPSLLVFEGETSPEVDLQPRTQRSRACGGQCGVVGSPVDTTEVFAFHLDRVLGLNRTLPAVSRRFSFLHDGQPCPVVSWDASLYPEGRAAGWSSVRLTWGEYQSALKQRCWHKNISPQPDSGCSAVHHYEWSKLALFDFLLQIHNRLDQSCCGFRPRQEDVCVELGHNAECGDQSRIQLTHIVHRGHDPGRLVFTNNEGFFDRSEDNLDYRLLEGIKELPEQAVSVLKNKRLREKLLQSLFLDQTYWESQGGRPGIDKLIDVIERRAAVLLAYVNAHGIRVTAMSA